MDSAVFSQVLWGPLDTRGITSTNILSGDMLLILTLHAATCKRNLKVKMTLLFRLF